MKKIAIFIILIIFTSCAMEPAEDFLPRFDTPDDAAVWISQNIDGEMDSTIYPISVILDRMSGGCTAFAGLFLYILDSQFGERGLIVLTVKHGYGHVIVYYNDTYYDLTNKDCLIVPEPDKILGYWTLDYYNFKASFYKVGQT